MRFIFDLLVVVEIITDCNWIMKFFPALQHWRDLIDWKIPGVVRACSLLALLILERTFSCTNHKVTPY